MSTRHPLLARFATPLFIVLLLTLQACGDIARFVAPQGQPRGPAHIALSASLNASVARASTVTLEIRASYLRKQGDPVPLGTQVLAIGNAEEQAIPVPVDIASCLSDPQRDVVNAGDISCRVLLQLSLIVNGVVVDMQTVGPLQLTPGATTTVNDPVTLSVITDIELSVENGPPLPPLAPLAASSGSSLGLRAVIRDEEGRLVTNRSVEWRSDVPTVATVDENGVVSAIAPGITAITATLGTLTSGVVLTVTEPPVQLRVVAAASSGNGVVKSVPAGIECRIDEGVATGSCAFAFPHGTVVTLQRTADAGNTFGNWGAGCAGTSIGDDCALTLLSPVDAAASFARLRRVSVTATGDGSGVVAGSFGIDCQISNGATSGACVIDVPQGTSVTLTASPAPAAGTLAAHKFSGWGGACSAQTGTTCVIVASADIAASAQMNAPKTLTVALQGEGAGQVAGSAISCSIANGTQSGSCAGSYVHGTVVTLTVAPGGTSRFGGWSGACSGTGSTCSVTLDAPKTVGATITRNLIPVTVAITGDGVGAVSVNGGNCSNSNEQPAVSCVLEFEAGTVLAISASAANTSRFEGFSGACSGTGNCQVILSAPITIGARFALKPVLVSVQPAGRGSGTVTGTIGISCVATNGAASGTCEQDVTAGTSVTLSASPNAWSTFAGWSGACSGTSPNCSFTANAASVAVANFVPKKVQLTLNLTGDGAGSVAVAGATACTRTSASPGTVTCTLDVDAGVPTPIGALAGTNSRFDGFTGACSGTGNCTVSFTAATSIEARFTIDRVNVAIISGSTGSATGTITGSGFNCSLAAGTASGTCSAAISRGALIQVQASPGANSALVGWGGLCAGADTQSCSFTVNQAGTINASFTAGIEVRMNISGNGAGSVNFDVTGIPRQSTCMANGTNTVICTYRLPVGFEGIFRATSASGSAFSGFTGPCSDAGSPPFATCTFRGTTFARDVYGSFIKP